MPKYKITVKDLSAITDIDTFNAIQYAENKEQAIEDVKDFYSCELGTNPNEIEIVSINEIKE